MTSSHLKAILNVRMLAVIAAITASITVAACDGAERIRDEQGQDVAPTGEPDEYTDTTEYAAAYARFEECAIDAGYDVTDPDGVLLRDGTRWRLGRDSITITGSNDGAMLDLFTQLLTCEEGSGLAALTAAAGHGPVTNDAVRGAERRKVEQMACMEERGWDVPEPTKLPVLGILVFDVRVSDEEQAAYDVDLAECVPGPEGS